jgi:C_GCAxxG_C_C family probable redox protein
MKNNHKTAKDLFQNGFNCSQAVFAAFCEEAGLSREDALRIASGFGAGMGRLQNTCGAITGAFMVLSSLYGHTDSQETEKKEKAYSMIQQFARDFSKIHGSINCLKLIDCDLKTEEGRKFAEEQNLFSQKCSRFVEDAAILLETKYL